MLLLEVEQLGSSLRSYWRENLKKFWTHVFHFQAYKEFGRKIHVENSEEFISQNLSSATIIFRLERIFFFYRKWIDKGVCWYYYLLEIFWLKMVHVGLDIILYICHLILSLSKRHIYMEWLQITSRILLLYWIRAYIEEIGSGPLSFPIIVYRSRGNKRYVPE